MASRASTRTRLRVLPVFIALIFNVIAPVASIAAPDGAAGLLGAPEPVAAAAPEQVTFTLEGCNLTTGTYIESTLTCTEPGYTTGNLGKLWAELDRVPHRLTAENKTVAQTYDIKLSADHVDDGFEGYDEISVPTLKSGACTFTISDQFDDAGVAGGADSTISRTMTVTQPANSTCVFDFNMRLALGSAQYPGSSLRAYLIAEGVGAKSVPLPVDKDFPAQELRKEMAATQGQAYGWSVSKSSDPTSLDFPNTCLPGDAARTATVDVTISWTRTGPTASGATLITTRVYAENPSERTIQVSVTDDIYTGSAATNSEATRISSASAGPVNVPANSEVLVLEHVFEYGGSATQFNDVATATHTDPVNPDVAIPGTTTATADATTQPAGGDADNSSAIITDTEWITGEGLSFSVAAPDFGSFTNGYVAGNEVLPGASVDWSSGVVTGDGEITFTKTVYVDEPRIIASGAALSDAASVLTADGQETLATSGQLDVDITADASVSLTIDKSIVGGALRAGESVTFEFEIYAGSEVSGDPVATTSISFDAGGATAKSATVTGLDPGTYTVHEVPEPNWVTLDDETVSINLPTCSATVEFGNTERLPDLSATKTADDATVSAGEQIGFTIAVSNGDGIGTGIAKDVEVEDLLPAGDGIDWSIADDSPDGHDCAISGAPGAELLACAFGDLAPGASASVHVVSDTTADSCKVYENTATISATNADEFDTEPATSEVECTGLNIIKRQVDESGTPTTDPILAGDTAHFEILVWNAGPGQAKDVVMSDDLPAGLTWDFEITDGDGECFPASSQEEGGEVRMSIMCELGDLEVDESVTILVWADTDRTDCGALANAATVDGSNNDEGVLAAEATILVSCPDVPSLVIDKAADAEVITITLDGDDQAIDPEVVTWTLTYTLANGPVTNAVITDEIPEGLVYVDGSASDGGVYDAATETLTWTFATLSESGSVTFVTEVDPESISRVGPTVNVAVISSDQTPEDEGQDQVTVTVEQELGGNPTPTPAPRLPDTAMGIGIGGEPITVPVELLAAAFVTSLGALALANVRARSRRR